MPEGWRRVRRVETAWVGDSEDAGRAVVGEGETEKLGGEGLGFGVIEC